MALISSQASLIIDGQPSCIQFVPNHPRYAVIGTYELENDDNSEEAEDKVTQKQTRKGGLSLLRVVDSTIEIVQTQETEHGILHLHFSPWSPELFCTANSNGTISFYRVTTDGNLAITEPLFEQRVTDDPSIVVHYVQWHPVEPTLLAITLSSGEGLLVAFESSELFSTSVASHSILSKSIKLGDLTSHSDQAWTLSFAEDGEKVLTGGDDSVLQYAQLASRSPTGDQKHLCSDIANQVVRQNIWAGVMSHGAGVTSILPLKWPIILTGSYDDHIRVVQANDRKPKVLAELNLGGGVWRLRVLEDSFDDASLHGQADVDFLVLASCMYSGTRVVKVNRSRDASWSVEIVARFEEHKSMNYGSDWISDETVPGGRTIISTSFYDRLVCLWKYPASWNSSQ